MSEYIKLTRGVCRGLPCYDVRIATGLLFFYSDSNLVTSYKYKQYLLSWVSSALHSKCVLTSPKIIGYDIEKKVQLFGLVNTKISLTSEITISPNVKLLANG